MIMTPNSQSFVTTIDKPVVPQDWQSVQLRHIAVINPGVVHHGSLSGDTMTSFVPMAAVSEQSGSVVTEEERPLSKVDKGFTPFEDGDILVAKITPCFENGKIALAKIKHKYGFGSTEFFVVRPGQSVNARYVFYFLRQKQIREVGVSHMTGSAGQKRLPRYYLETLQILLPSAQAQARIVEILDEADTAVGTTEALIAAKLAYKTALAERLLTGRQRFPEFAGQEWREAKLGDLFTERSKRHSGNEPPVVLSCSKLYGILPQSERFSKQIASRDQTRYKLVEPGDLVFDPMLLWDASLAFSKLHGVVSPAYCTLQFVAADADPRFVHYLFYTHAMRHMYKTISQGTNTRRKKVTSRDFLKAILLLPSEAEQRRIADVLDLMDQEISLLKRQLAAQKQQKEGLMQTLLTGQTRVKEFAT